MCSTEHMTMRGWLIFIFIAVVVVILILLGVLHR